MDKALRQTELDPPLVENITDINSVVNYLIALNEYLIEISINTQKKFEQFSYNTLGANATPDVSSFYKHSYWSTSGTTTITNFLKGFHGQIITVLGNSSLTITHGTNIFLVKGSSYAIVAGKSITLICKSDDKWYELGISV